MGHPPEIFSYGIYPKSQIFGTSQYAKFGEKIAVIAAKMKMRFSYFAELTKICMSHAQIMVTRPPLSKGF